MEHGNASDGNLYKNYEGRSQVNHRVFGSESEAVKKSRSFACYVRLDSNANGRLMDWVGFHFLRNGVWELWWFSVFNNVLFDLPALKMKFKEFRSRMKDKLYKYQPWNQHELHPYSSMCSFG